MVETTFEAAIRHLKSGDVSPATIKRGLDRVKGDIYTRNLDQCKIAGSRVERDFGQAGLDVTTYELSMPRAWGGFDNEEKFKIIEVSVVDFPVDSHLRVLVLTPDSQIPVRFPDTRRIVDAYPETIASFAGPTFKAALPNNGFYSREPSAGFVPFAETEPVGQRRGAIGVDVNGTVRLLDDSEKWQVVKSNFEGYEVVSGTSYYFSSEDDVAELASDKAARIKTSISYLVQYQLENGEQRFGYFISVMPLTRVIAKMVLDQHAKAMGCRSYRAVELELRGAHCVLKAADGSRRSIGNEVASFARADYYLIERKQTGKSA